MTDADLVAALDAVVNADAVTVLRDTTFSTGVHITGPCIVMNCRFPGGLTIGRGGSIRFEGENWITSKNGQTYCVRQGAMYSTEHTDP